MSKLRPTPPLLRAIVATASLVLSLTCLPGGALCASSDGHLAIEAIGADCLSPSASISTPHVDGALAGRSLHGCIDTPLGAPSLPSSTNPIQAIHCAVPSAVIGLVPDRGSAVSIAGARAAPAAGPSTALSTVLLL